MRDHNRLLVLHNPLSNFYSLLSAFFFSLRSLFSTPHVPFSGVPSLLFACLLLTLLLQGCMTEGVYQVKVLSYTGGVIPPRAAPLPLVAGVRIDADKDETQNETQDATKGAAQDEAQDEAKEEAKEEANTAQPVSPVERFVLGSLAAELSAANLFRQVTYPMSGGEDVMFKVTTWGRRQGPTSNPPLVVAQVFICTVTVLILCPPVSATYEYNIMVRAVKQPENQDMGWHLARGKSRTRYGIFSSNEADVVGWQAAATSAFDETMSVIRMDETGWFVGAVR